MKSIKNSDVLAQIQNSDKQKVKVAVTDMDGILRGKYLHKDKFLSSAKTGFGFCSVVFGWDSSDVCYDNVSFTGWHTGYPDTLARIDLGTYRKIPWENQVPLFLADFEDQNGLPLPICPRALLKKTIAKAEKAGFHPSTGMEFEWFNFKETSQTLNDKKFTSIDPLTPGMFGYSLIRMSQNRDYFTALMDELLAFGIPLEGLHTETGPGVYEAAIAYSDALEAADRAVLFKTAVKEIAQRFGIIPSFMAKWNSALPGCSGHSHQSLWDGDRNLFFDEKDPHKMSEVFNSYVAGLLHCLPEILPLFAPTVNSYKRLVEGYWAPTKATWGIDNRTVAVRVISGGPKSTRAEMRVPGSDVNPYLCGAASIAAGLYGIEKGFALTQPPVTGSAYTNAHDVKAFPKNLYEATMRMSESKIAHALFGEPFVDHFVKTRLWEWKQFQNSVTNWELQRYFEII